MSIYTTQPISDDDFLPVNDICRRLAEFHITPENIYSYTEGTDKLTERAALEFDADQIKYINHLISDLFAHNLDALNLQPCTTDEMFVVCYDNKKQRLGTHYFHNAYITKFISDNYYAV